MLKAGIITRMAKSAGITKAQAKLALEIILTTTTSSLQQGHPVKLKNFGTFCINSCRQRVGVHPSTGLPVPYQRQKSN